MAISRETVKHVARLAQIELQASEVDQLAEQLSSILEHVTRLQAVDTTSVDYAEHIEHSNMPTRPDIVRPSWSPVSVLANAPLRTDDLFQVQAVLEES